MNERIKELAEQAGATTTHRSGWIDYGTLDLDVEKFAELIVQECIDLVPWMYEAKIKEHFGVNDDQSRIDRYFEKGQ